MSSSSRRARLRHKVLLDKTAPDRSLRMHESHDSAENIPNAGKREAESTAIMVVAGKKADAQRQNRAARTEPAPQLLSPSVILSSIMPFTTAFGLVSTPPMIFSSTSVSLSASSLPQSTEQKQTSSEPLASFQPTTSPVSLSRSPSIHVPPALLAFILIFACLFCLVMFLAFRRMCCYRRSRLQLASPLFLGNATGFPADHGPSKTKLEDKQTMVARDAAMLVDWDRPGHSVEGKTSPFKNAEHMVHGSTLFNVHTDTLNTPLPIHVAGSTQRTHSRPYVPRAYHRPHTAYTGDPESLMPLMFGEGFKNGDNRRARSKGGSDQNRVRGRGKGKENMMQDTVANRAGAHRNSFLAHSVKRASRPLSVGLKAVDFSTASDTDNETRSGFPSSSSVVSMRRGDTGDPKSTIVQPLPSAGSVAVDIGLAMLTEFSSPNVGLAFEPQSMYSPLAMDHISSGPASDNLLRPSNVIDSGDGSISLLSQSTSSETRGLAYLASESSHNLMGRSMMGERDIMVNHANIVPALEDIPDQEPDARAQAHARLVEQLGLAIDPDANDPSNVPPSVSFKAPFLPTLSEMALYRADPLYESVTNELFASYGVRMSTASATGRMSRVSARISRMLSWFGDVAPNKRLSIGDRMSNEIERMSAEVSATAGGGVQPLRIGKLR